MRWSLAMTPIALLGVFVACSSSDSESERATGAAEPGVGDGASRDEALDAAQTGDPEDAVDRADEAGAPRGDGEGSPDPVGFVEGERQPGGQAAPDGAGESGDDGGEADPEPAGEPGEPEPVAPSGVCPPGPFPSSPLDGASAPETVCTGMAFTEGPVWFAERGTLFFSDISFFANGNGGTIFSYVPGRGCTPFVENAGTNGLAIASDGNLLGARHGDGTLTLFDVDTGEPSVFLADNDGLAFNAPNDIAIRSDGNLYFTDPGYLRGNRPQEQPLRAYWRAVDGTLHVIDEGANANGITLSPDETRLYLSHLGGGANDIVAFDVDESGAVSEPAPFASIGSDGMVVDCAGNLYATEDGVQIFDPEGNLVGRIDAPGAANVAFGGPERRTLYVTATSSLLAVELAVAGLPY